MSLLDGLVSYWDLDEAAGNRADSHGANTLVDNGTVDSAAGRLNNAADFDVGVPEYFTVAANQDLDIDSVNGMTLAGHIKATNHNADRRFFGKEEGTPASCYKAYYEQADDKIYFKIEDSAAGVSVATSGVVVEATYYFVALIYDPATKKAGISIDDGAIAWGAALTNGPKTGQGIFYMGAGQAAVNRALLGFMDEWGKWDRVLTGDELDTLEGGGTPPGYDSFGAVASPQEVIWIL